MTDSLFSTRYYSYPKLDEDIRDKMQHLRQSIAKLEANMITNACGLVCLTLTEERYRRLELPLMNDRNQAKFSTNFTVSIEAAEGVTTGISAADRARTIQATVSATAKAEDIVQPGHIFPIMAKKGGVLHRAGHTEASCDLARLAGLEPAAVIVEIINPDGTTARRDDLEKFAAEHDLKIGTIANLINYRIANEQTVNEVSKRPFETDFGTFTLYQLYNGLNGINFNIVNPVWPFCAILNLFNRA